MSARDLEFGPVSPYGGLFARDLRVGDVIRTPERRWVPIVQIEDSPHGDRAIELASGEILMSDLAEDKIFEILPGTIADVDDALAAAQTALGDGYLDVAGDAAVLVYQHRDATDEHRDLARIVLESVHAIRSSVR